MRPLPNERAMKRLSNERAVLELIEKEGPLSVPELATFSGTGSTARVRTIVKHLTTSGVLEPLGTNSTNARRYGIVT